MNGSTPQTFSINDFLKWNVDQELELNPKFQRGSVWTPPARTYLIDSILRGYPIPKLLLRTTVDRDSRRTVRDVVDGQQRLRTIFDFADGKFALGPKANDFQGQRYADLDDDLKDAFLAYKLTCEQLINASDDDVLEVFVRINSYAIPVNDPELRNARYENDFSELVKSIAKESRSAWDLGILSNRERVRMLDQSVIAEILGFWLFGVTDGGEQRLNRLYEELKHTPATKLPPADQVLDLLDNAALLLEPMRGEPLVQRPHFLMIIAALMYKVGVLPEGRLSFDGAPAPAALLVDQDAAREELATLNSALAGESTSVDLTDFVQARASAQRIKSRQVRFDVITKALAGALWH